MSNYYTPFVSRRVPGTYQITRNPPPKNSLDYVRMVTGAIIMSEKIKKATHPLQRLIVPGEKIKEIYDQILHKIKCSN